MLAWPVKKPENPPCATGGEYDIICTVFGKQASLTQLVECHLAKVVVEGSSPLARSNLAEDSEMGA